MKKIILSLVAFAILISTFSFSNTAQASTITFTRNLSYGVTTTEVSSLQQFLTDEGIYNGPITSTFGPLTRKAVIAFQSQQGIAPASGYFGPLTRAYANKILADHPEWTTNLSNDNYYQNVNGNTVHSPAYSSYGVPAGATAECRDGTYSFSLNHRGSCSHHGGVANWL